MALISSSPERSHAFRVAHGRFLQLRIVRLMVARDLKVKYRGTVIGYVWSMLNPLLFMAILTLVFSHFVKGIEHYPVFVLSGILIWNVASQSIVMGTQSLITNAGLLKKVKLPMWTFPLVPLGATSVNFLLALVPFAILTSFMGPGLPLSFLAFPVVLALFLTFLAGIAVTLSCLNVFFRDVGHVLEPVLSLTFYATPIIYNRTGEQFSPEISRLLGFNPFTHFVEAFRACLFGGQFALTTRDLLLLFSMATVSLAVGGFVYSKSQRRIIFHL